MLFDLFEGMRCAHFLSVLLFNNDCGYLRGISPFLLAFRRLALYSNWRNAQSSELRGRNTVVQGKKSEIHGLTAKAN